MEQKHQSAHSFVAKPAFESLSSCFKDAEPEPPTAILSWGGAPPRWEAAPSLSSPDAAESSSRDAWQVPALYVNLDAEAGAPGLSVGWSGPASRMLLSL